MICIGLVLVEAGTSPDHVIRVERLCHKYVVARNRCELVLYSREAHVCHEVVVEFC